MPGGGDRGGEPNPEPEKRLEAENREMALKCVIGSVYTQSQLYGAINYSLQLIVNSNWRNGGSILPMNVPIKIDVTQAVKSLQVAKIKEIFHDTKTVRSHTKLGLTEKDEE